MREANAIGETGTKAISGTTEVTAVFFDFKTGGGANAGTDARVAVRIGERLFQIPGRRGGHDLFEPGGVDVIGFPVGRLGTPPGPRLDLDALRRAPIVLSRDGSGSRPAWRVERMSLLVRLALPQEPVLEYKRWTDPGWLETEKSPRASVVLQEAACAHPVPRERCASCKLRWPQHPGTACHCPSCASSYPRLLHA